MHPSQNRHIVDLLFVLALFAVFTLSSMLLIILGTHIYQNTINDMDANFSTRTSYAYFTEKIRQNSEYDNITVSSMDGYDYLDMTQIFDGSVYHTYLYEYDGYLCECFIREENGFEKEYGTKVLPLSHLSIQNRTNHLLAIQYLDEHNESISIMICTQP